MLSIIRAFHPVFNEFGCMVTVKCIWRRGSSVALRSMICSHCLDDRKNMHSLCADMAETHENASQDEYVIDFSEAGNSA